MRVLVLFVRAARIAVLVTTVRGAVRVVMRRRTGVIMFVGMLMAVRVLMLMRMLVLVALVCVLMLMLVFVLMLVRVLVLMLVFTLHRDSSLLFRLRDWPHKQS